MSDRYWIFKGTSNFCSELELSDEDFETMIKSKPEGFYDIVATQDTVEGGTEVVTVESVKSQLIEAIEKWNDGIEARHLGKIPTALKDFLLKELGLT
jgi:hypothetical protein